MKEEATTNLTMLCDFYELTMGNGYFINGMADTITYFDVFFRRCPDEGGFAIAAGLEQVIDYINNLHFTEAELDEADAACVQRIADAKRFALESPYPDAADYQKYLYAD